MKLSFCNFVRDDKKMNSMEDCISPKSIATLRLLKVPNRFDSVESFFLSTVIFRHLTSFDTQFLLETKNRAFGKRPWTIRCGFTEIKSSN